MRARVGLLLCPFLSNVIQQTLIRFLSVSIPLYFLRVLLVASLSPVTGLPFAHQPYLRKCSYWCHFLWIQTYTTEVVGLENLQLICVRFAGISRCAFLQFDKWIQEVLSIIFTAVGVVRRAWTFPHKAGPGLLLNNFDENPISGIHRRYGLFQFLCEYLISRLDTFVS